VELGEDGFEAVDVDVVHPLEELAANFLEARFEARNDAKAATSGSEDRKAMLARVTCARQKAAGFEAVDEARDARFIPADGLRELSGGRLSFGSTVEEHGGFLSGHTERTEAAVESGLHANAGSKET